MNRTFFALMVFLVDVNAAVAVAPDQNLEEASLKLMCAPEIQRVEMARDSYARSIRERTLWTDGYRPRRSKIKAMYGAYYDRVVKGAVQPVVDEMKRDKALVTLMKMKARSNAPVLEDQVKQALRPYLDRIRAKLETCSSLPGEHEKLHPEKPAPENSSQQPSCVRTIDDKDHYVIALEKVSLPSTGAGFMVTTSFELGRTNFETEYNDLDQTRSTAILKVPNCEALGITDPSELSKARCIVYEGVERRIDLSSDLKIPSKASFVAANMKALDDRKNIASSLAEIYEREVAEIAASASFAPECRRFLKNLSLKKLSKTEEDTGPKDAKVDSSVPSVEKSQSSDVPAQ